MPNHYSRFECGTFKDLENTHLVIVGQERTTCRLASNPVSG
jgi:hypothetical protein